ncbi:four helix bundle protein [Faecalispora jeddahensis]|uniref:four helix bundle protein n=1 Tax=Faecalispora jeddahensis TaxID=1414721 RepID=UPI0027B928EB|nr:four helix bundle protein [Faecalispora jeddahensis]
MLNRQGDLTIVCKARDLVNHTLTLTNNCNLFPKKVRFTLCQRMQDVTMQILHDIIAANEIYPKSLPEMEKRLDLQKEVLTNCKIFLNFLDIALEQGYIDIRRCEHWTGLTTDVKNLAASWRKKDAERFRQQVSGPAPPAPARR